MSIEKVKRYDMHYRPGWAYNQASMMPTDQGRYIEYADVAGLVEALRKAYAWLDSTGHVPGLSEDIDNELARWQS